MNPDGAKSRTRKKKEDRALQRLGENLLELSADELAAIEMPEELTEAVCAGKITKQHGARRRQLQYIGALMRKIDTEPIRAALDKHRHGDNCNKLRFKQLESWRDALKCGDDAVVEEILARCPEARRQDLMALVASARAEAGAGQAVKESRMLFRYLKKVCASAI